jgi:hypothetical protein
MLKSPKSFAGMGIPNFPRRINVSGDLQLALEFIYAVKSAAAVAAKAASGERRACQTAPLCPKKVPILFSLSMGLQFCFKFNLPVSSYAVPKHWVVVSSRISKRME